MTDSDLKVKTARSLKWNFFDRVATQVLYAVTGIVLARVLSQEDFGLVGAILIFQAFASLLIEGGFSSALIQRKNTTDEDYSTVLWFNLGVAVILYVILFISAPLIADCFQGNEALIPLSRVMFLSLILNASSIVQANRLMKQMNVRPIAVTNAVGLIAGGIVGIWMALSGYGAWAIVWQTIVNAGVKSALLWSVVRWMPAMTFSWKILKGFFAVGSGIMAQSFLNTVFLNIYSFVIGNRVGLTALGYYTQADKWSKMGIMSLSQTLTSAFLPALSDVQDSVERFARAAVKMNRLCSYLLFPFTGLLLLIATPVFHALFGIKWDSSIVLFQLLLMRGVFTVLTGLYNNFLLAKGYTRTIVWMEILRDVAALLALVATFPFMGMQTEDNPVYGIKILLYGQLVASALAWGVTLVVTARKTDIAGRILLHGMLPYIIISALSAAPCVLFLPMVSNPWILLIIQSIVYTGVYMLLNAISGSKIQEEAIAMLKGKL